MKPKLEKILIEEIKAAEEVRGEYIPLLPIALMYQKTDHRLFLNKTRDYLWFNEYDM